MIFDHKMQKKVKSKVPTLRKIGQKIRSLTMLGVTLAWRKADDSTSIKVRLEKLVY